MKVSYQWLQEYFDDPLPKPEDLADMLTMHAFEVEDVEAVGDDWVLDVDVLPNRAHDCLGHRGIAREIGVLAGLALKKPERALLETHHPNGISVDIEDAHACRRYIGKVVGNLVVGPSPDWLKKRLETLGQRSINNVVDVTNYIMLDTGQPMHAFDLDKLDSEHIFVRNAKAGERITTLDGKEVELDESMLVIADAKDPLAIAGVKGGKKAEVDESTKRIVLEAANFDPVRVRKTARTTNILTDSSKRFENELTPDIAEEAIEEAAFLIHDMNPDAHIELGESVDAYPKQKAAYKVGVTTEQINKRLGTDLKDGDVEEILQKLGFSYEIVADPVKKVLEVAQTVVGTPYKRPSAMQYDAPHAFSCTSLISYLFVQAGVYMPSLSVDKYAYGMPVDQKDIQPGDVVFVNTGEGTDGKAPVIHYETIEWLPGTPVPEGVDHAGIYLGEGNILHTSWDPGSAVVEKLIDAKQFKNIVGVRRFVDSREKRYVVTVPVERLDLRIKEDVIEEIARVYGYRNIDARVPQKDTTQPIESTRFYYAQRVRNIMTANDFSEVYTYTFRDSGPRKVANPITEDKKALRKNITDGLAESLDMNLKYTDLLGGDYVRIFEIEKVFTKEGEHTTLAFGVKNKKGIKPAEKEVLETVLKALENEFGIRPKGELSERPLGVVFECDFDAYIEKLPTPESYGDVLKTASMKLPYKPVSQYPFVTRDVALWTPKTVAKEEVSDVLQEHAGELLVRTPRLFDVFEKDDKISYAFRLVFQSYEKTLTDEEVNKVMDGVNESLAERAWEVR